MDTSATQATFEATTRDDQQKSELIAAATDPMIDAKGLLDYIDKNNIPLRLATKIIVITKNILGGSLTNDDLADLTCDDLKHLTKLTPFIADQKMRLSVAGLISLLVNDKSLRLKI